MVAKVILTVVLDYNLFYYSWEQLFSTGALVPLTNTTYPPLILALKVVQGIKNHMALTDMITVHILCEPYSLHSHPPHLDILITDFYFLLPLLKPVQFQPKIHLNFG